MVLELFKEAVEREMLENWDQSWMWYGLGWGGGVFFPGGHPVSKLSQQVPGT